MDTSIPVTNIQNIDECTDGYLLGDCQIAGVNFHATFIRVKEGQHGQTVDSEDGTTTSIWDDITRLDESAFKTIEVPGQPGRWVLIL